MTGSIKHLKPHSIIAAVRSYGIVAFLGDEGDTKSDVAAAATSAITDLDQENLALSSFFSSRLSDDASYESIRYSVAFNSPELSVGMLVKTITYRPIAGIAIRSPKVVYGPYVNRQWKGDRWVLDPWIEPLLATLNAA